MRLAALKRNKFDYPVYLRTIKQKDSAERRFFMEYFETKYGNRKHDPDLHAVAKAFMIITEGVKVQ